MRSRPLGSRNMVATNYYGKCELLFQYLGLSFITGHGRGGRGRDRNNSGRGSANSRGVDRDRRSYNRQENGSTPARGSGTVNAVNLNATYVITNTAGWPVKSLILC
jgi:hypothetical protein